MSTSNVLTNIPEKADEETTLVSDASIQAKHLDPDKILKQFGMGRYQLTVFLLITAPAIIYSANMMGMPFLLEETHDFECRLKGDAKTEGYTVIDQCTVSKDAQNFTCSELARKGITYYHYVNQSKDYTITTHFDLVCENSWMRDHGSSVFLVGCMIASSISVLSDIYGRRLVFIFTMWCNLLFNVFAIFSPTYEWFLGMRLIAGIAAGGNGMVGSVLSNEMVTPRFREFGPSITAIFWTLGYYVAAGTRVTIDHWKWIYFISSIPAIFTIPYIFILPESIHWMATNGKIDGIKRYIHTAKKANGVKEFDLHKCLLEQKVKEDDVKPKNPFLFCLSSGRMLFLFVICCFLAISMNITYWGLSLNSTELSKNKIVGFILSGTVEVPAAFVAVLFLRLFPRRIVSLLAFGFTALSMFGAVMLPHEPFPLLMGLSAKIANSVVWGCLPLAMNEMIPTPIRNFFGAAVGLSGDLGGVVAPYLGELNYIHADFPSLLFAVLGAVSAVLVLALPETKGIHLSGDMESFDEGPFLRAIRRSRPTSRDHKQSVIEMKDIESEASSTQS